MSAHPAVEHNTSRSCHTATISSLERASKELAHRKYLEEIDLNYNCSDRLQCDRVNIWTFLPLHWEIPATMSWLFGQKWRQQSSGQIFVNQPKNYTAVPVLMLDDCGLSVARLYF